jgi:hypothetical protein
MAREPTFMPRLARANGGLRGAPRKLEAGHKPSFPTRSKIFPRRSDQRPLSGSECEPLFGSARPQPDLLSEFEDLAPVYQRVAGFRRLTCASLWLDPAIKVRSSEVCRTLPTTGLLTVVAAPRTGAKRDKGAFEAAPRTRALDPSGALGTRSANVGEACSADHDSHAPLRTP